MKDISTGKTTGEPLPHDEWIKAQVVLNSPVGTANGEPAGDDEPTFHDKPLSFYEGKSDDEILDIEGIGPGILKKIRAAQAAQ